jgi:galactose-1-phosphate uridylyltransferase
VCWRFKGSKEDSLAYPLIPKKAMAEIRRNPITKDWVVMASERTERPDDFKEVSSHPHLYQYRPDCPFCPGNEKLTPRVIFVKVVSSNLETVPSGLFHRWNIVTLAVETF